MQYAHYDLLFIILFFNRSEPNAIGPFTVLLLKYFKGCLDIFTGK